MNHSMFAMDLLSQFLTEHPIDVLNLQDPPCNLYNGLRSFHDFKTFLPSYGNEYSKSFPQDSLTAILIWGNIDARPISFLQNRLCGVYIPSSLCKIAIVSAYFHYANTLIFSFSSLLGRIQSKTPFVLVRANMNGHSCCWGPMDQISNASGELVEEFVLNKHFIGQNHWPCPPAFASNQCFKPWINATLSFLGLSKCIYSWHVLDTVFLGSDHFPFIFGSSFPIKYTRPFPRLDWKLVSWTNFQIFFRIFVTGIHTSEALSDGPSVA